jgi:hypothetical protein
MVNVATKTRKRLAQPQPLGQPAKEKKDKPWHQYQPERNWKLLIPGWGGHLDEDELAFIVEHLKNDAALRLWWGMKPSWKRVPEEVVRRLAMEGSEDNQSLNRRLARPRRQSLAAA